MSYEENYEENYESSFSKSFDYEKVKFEELMKSKLIISLVGDVNAGKSSTINALTGRKLAEVNATTGWTKYVKLHEYSENVYVADTPGLHDPDESISKKTENFVNKDTDVILFFFSASNSPRKEEIDMLNNLKKLKKPIITILNWIDIWFEKNSEGLYTLTEDENFNDVMSKIKKETGEDAIPISAKRNINIEGLNKRIIEVLENQGKSLLYLKISKYKEDKISIWINGAAVSAFGIGIIPIPGADIVPLTSLQVGLGIKIAYVYECKVTKNDVMSLLGATVTGSIGKQLFRLGLEGLKALGWVGGPIGESGASILAGTVAASVTYGFGWAANAYYKSGMQIDLGDIGDIYKNSYNNYKNKKK